MIVVFWSELGQVPVVLIASGPTEASFAAEVFVTGLVAHAFGGVVE